MTKAYSSRKHQKHPKNKSKKSHKALYITLSCFVIAALGATGGWIAHVRDHHDDIAEAAAQQKAAADKQSAFYRKAIPTSPPPASQVPVALPPIETTDYKIPPVTDGVAPVLSRIPTKESVVFLGIDDGVYREPQAAKLMQDNGVKASLFLTNKYVVGGPSYFANVAQTSGSLIEDHTLDHHLMTTLNYDQQKQEVCDTADKYTTLFNRRPVLFRPPGGAYDLDTQKAAAACNMKAVIMWDVTVNNGALQYQVGHQLRPGDIVLMHFRTTFVEDMQAFIDAAKAQGLHTELLENWASN